MPSNRSVQTQSIRSRRESHHTSGGGHTPHATTAKLDRARGNMLVTLAVGKNPTTVLLAAIRQRRLQGLGVNQKGGKGPGKDEEFYLALLRRNGVSRSLTLMTL